MCPSLGRSSAGCVLWQGCGDQPEAFASVSWVSDAELLSCVIQEEGLMAFAQSSCTKGCISLVFAAGFPRRAEVGSQLHGICMPKASVPPVKAS